MDSLTSPSLFLQTADVRTQRSGNNALEVFVSIGGWTFSDNHTETQPVFTNIASNAGNRQKFADNLLSFMKRYGFDGADIDWEYPGRFPGNFPG
jgi:chitinase